MRSIGTPGKPLLIVQTGSTYPEISHNAGDFSDWIASGLSNPENLLRIDAREVSDFPLISTIAGVVVSGSHAMVTDREEWSERLATWLIACVDAQIPILGICYGHQLLAQALGGRVGFRSDGLEIGTRIATLTNDAAEDALFKAAPPMFPVQLVHAQSVLELPPGATLLASSDAEPHQAFRVGHCAWGVQFHPEFSAQVMRGYIQCATQSLATKGRDPAHLTDNVQETLEAAAILKRFAAIVAA